MADTKKRGLSARFVETVRLPGRYSDTVERGLVLAVNESGSKNWGLRIVVDGKQKWFGLGGFPSVGLKTAREKAAELRGQLKRGINPKEEREREKAERRAESARLAAIPTLAEMGQKVYEGRLPTWKPGSKHIVHWLPSVEKHCGSIWHKRVDQITLNDIESVLLPIWGSRTATVVKTKLALFFDAAMADDRAKGPMLQAHGGLNPAKHKFPTLPDFDTTNHHAAVAYTDLPALLQEVKGYGNGHILLLCFEFIILTAGRSGEIRGARWSEMDLENATWSIPGIRMKTKKPHTVPLSDRAMEILTQELTPGKGIIFPGRGSGGQWSEVSLLRLLEKTGYKAVDEHTGELKTPTMHGFRTTFSQWAEARGILEQVSEACLSHVFGSTVRRAYKRGNYLEERRPVMQAWADYLKPD